MEFFHRQKGFHPVDLNRMALRCMEQGCRKGIKSHYAPNNFSVHLSPSDHHDLFPFLDTIRSDIFCELDKVVSERGYILAGKLRVQILEDKQTEEGLPQVTGSMEGGDEPETFVSFTADTQKTDHDKQPLETPKQKPIPLEPITMLEEGLTLLRDGATEEAMEIFSKTEDALGETSEFHAAMTVASQMKGDQEEAKKHMLLLSDLQNPQLPWKTDRTPEKNTECKTLKLETDIPGVSLLFGASTIQLENKYQDPSATVENKVAAVADIQEGDVVVLGTVRLHLVVSS